MQNRSVWFFPVAILAFAPVVCNAQEATPTPSPAEAEVEPVVVSATRFDIPLDQSPASASVLAKRTGGLSHCGVEWRAETGMGEKPISSRDEPV